MQEWLPHVHDVARNETFLSPSMALCSILSSSTCMIKLALPNLHLRPTQSLNTCITTLPLRCPALPLRSRALRGFKTRTKCIATMSLVGPESRPMLFCVLAGCAVIGQVMEAYTKLGEKLSSPLIAMGSGMLLSAIGILPSLSPAYDMVFEFLMPLAAVLCILETNVQRAFIDAGPSLKAFCLGSIGTIAGTIASFQLVGHLLGPEGWKIASCLCASYVGGSINYAATAQALKLSSRTLLAAGMAMDNIAMAFYFAVILSFPESANQESSLKVDADVHEETIKLSILSILSSLASAVAACGVGKCLASLLPYPFEGFGLALMTFVAALFSALVARLSCTTGTRVPLYAGSERIGGFLMLIFFAVVGASCHFQTALFGGWALLLFILILLTIHLAVILFLGFHCKLPLDIILVGSNANIGGPATAAAMANARCWRYLVRPAILVGTFGYTIGTLVGCLVGTRLLCNMFVF